MAGATALPWVAQQFLRLAYGRAKVVAEPAGRHLTDAQLGPRGPMEGDLGSAKWVGPDLP